jgi:CRISPR/Cas system-associated protein Cas7 (RAMP superfamily)
MRRKRYRERDEESALKSFCRAVHGSLVSNRKMTVERATFIAVSYAQQVLVDDASDAGARASVARLNCVRPSTVTSFVHALRTEYDAYVEEKASTSPARRSKTTWVRQASASTRKTS